MTLAIKKYNDDENLKKLKFSMISQTLQYLKPYKKTLIFIFVMGIFSTIFALMVPKLIGDSIDLLIEYGNVQSIFRNCVWCLFFIIALAILNKIRGNKLIQVQKNVSYDFRDDLMKKLVRLPQTYYDEVPHGKIYTRVTYYVDEVVNVLCNVVLDFLLKIITFIIIFIFMFQLQPVLTLMTFFLVLLFFLFFAFITPVWKKKQQFYQSKATNVNAYLSESLKGIPISQAFQREEKNIEIFKSLNEEKFNAVVPMMYYRNVSWSLPGIFNMVASVLIYIVGFYFFYPAFSIGSLLAFATYSTHFWSPISSFMDIYSSIIDSLNYLERIYDLLEYEEESQEGKNMMIQKGGIEFQHVTFGYNENEVLHDLSFQIPLGCKVAIVGATGSGKSTIVSLITRLYEINSGNILLDGNNINDFSLSSLRNQVMIMNQDGYFFTKTIYENLVLGKVDIPLKEVKKVCESLGIDDFISSLEKGYNTLITNNGSNFSTGEKQLLSLARMMLANPNIVILDEATSNIDLLTERKIVSKFFQAFEGKTSIVIAHRLSTILNSDIILVMKDGNLIEKGNHQELMKKKGTYYQLYKSQTI